MDPILTGYFLNVDLLPAEEDPPRLGGVEPRNQHLVRPMVSCHTQANCWFNRLSAYWTTIEKIHEEVNNYYIPEAPP